MWGSGLLKGSSKNRGKRGIVSIVKPGSPTESVALYEIFVKIFVNDVYPIAADPPCAPCFSRSVAGVALAAALDAREKISGKLDCEDHPTAFTMLKLRRVSVD